MLVARERIQIRKHGISLQMSGIADLQVQRVGVHAHDLGTHLVRAVREVDAVPERLAHLRLSVRSRKPLARFRLRYQRLRLHEHRLFRRIHCVELVYDLLRLLDHGKLILPHRNHIRLAERYIRRLTDRICKKSYRDACLEVSKLYLTLYCRISLQPGNRDEVHIIKCQLRELRYL